jgi:uncharacterized protein (DUF4415 family)
MANDRTRRPQDPFAAAQAVFNKAPPAASRLPDPKISALPGVKETVTLKIDADVLAVFQEGGPGWQDRINAALRKAAGK